MPIEADGPSMIEIIAALKADASAQENMSTIVGRVLDKTVQLNDAKGAGNTAYGCSLPLFHSTYKFILVYEGDSTYPASRPR
jgi:hypothetical protein